MKLLGKRKAKEGVYGCGERGHSWHMGLAEKDKEDRERWKWMIRFGDP